MARKKKEPLMFTDYKFIVVVDDGEDTTMAVTEAEAYKEYKEYLDAGYNDEDVVIYEIQYVAKIVPVEPVIKFKRESL